MRPRRTLRATEPSRFGVYDGSYRAGWLDPHFRVTGPPSAPTCSCEPPWIQRDADGETSGVRDFPGKQAVFGPHAREHDVLTFDFGTIDP